VLRDDHDQREQGEGGSLGFTRTRDRDQDDGAQHTKGQRSSFFIHVLVDL
jgi:hypothetical protein